MESSLEGIRLQRDQMRDVAFRGVELHKLHNLAQLLKLLVGNALRRPERGLSFQQMPNGGDVLQIFARKALDHDPAVRVRGDKVLQLELFERLTHGRAADAKLLCNLHFDEAVARLVASFGNAVP